MVHDRFEYEMPAPPEVVFDASHYHEWRLRWLLEPLAELAFDRQTHRRFERMRTFLAGHGHEVQAWQQREGLR